MFWEFGDFAQLLAQKYIIRSVSVVSQGDVIGTSSDALWMNG